MHLAASRSKESKPRPPLAPILQLVRASDMVITFGGLYHEPFRPPVVITYKDSAVPRLLQWQRTLVTAWRARDVSDDDFRDLMALHDQAQADGSLRTRRAGPHCWFTEEQLSKAIRITRWTFTVRWKRWWMAGWVESLQPFNPKHPVQRWLGKPPDEVPDEV